MAESIFSVDFMGFQVKYQRVIFLVQEIFANMLNHKRVSFDNLVKEINEIIVLADRGPGALTYLEKMPHDQDSLYTHCINVAIISRTLGKTLDFSENDLNNLLIAGVVHDVGKCKIPDEILNKSGKLSDEERAIVNKHPIFSHYLLEDVYLDVRVKKAALLHHERIDGSGYPMGLKQQELDDFSMIVAIADVYEAMTARKAYRENFSPFTVLQNFQEEGFGKYNLRYMLTFVRKVAEAHLNDKILLEDGRMGVVIMINQNDLARPVIRLDNGEFVDMSKNPSIMIKRTL